MADLKRSFDSVDELKDALKNDKVPLRNDKVKSLKKKLLGWM